MFTIAVILMSVKNMQIVTKKALLQRGKFSVDVILPAWWIKGHNLHAGSIVKMTATGRGILIETEGDLI
jgi:hypothetical protein